MPESEISPEERERTVAETRKLNAEALQLQAVARDLDRTPWQRPGTWVALASGLVALAAGLITIPSGYFSRIKTIAEQQQQISQDQTALSQLKNQMADEKLTVAQDSLQKLQTEIQTDRDKMKGFQQEEDKAKVSLQTQQTALATANQVRKGLEQDNLARSEAQAALDSLSADSNKSLILAMHSVRTGQVQHGAPIPETVEALRQVMFAHSRVTVTFPDNGSDIAKAVAWSPDASKVAVARDRIFIMDTSNWKPVDTPSFGETFNTSFEWAGNDQLLLSTNANLSLFTFSSKRLDQAAYRSGVTMVAASSDLKTFLVSIANPAEVPAVANSSPITYRLNKCNVSTIHFVPSGSQNGADHIATDNCSPLIDGYQYDSHLSVNSSFSRMAAVSRGILYVTDIFNAHTIKQIPFSDTDEILPDTQVNLGPRARLLTIIRKNASAEIRDANSLEPIPTPDLDGFIMTGSWTPDERYMIFATPSRLIVWNATSHKTEFRFQIHESQPISTSVSPDGSKLLIQELGKNASVYSLDVLSLRTADELIASAHRQVKKNLTAQDCAAILHQPTCPAIP